MKWWKSPKPDAPQRGAAAEQIAHLTRLAHRHLPQDVVPRWLALLRPAVRLAVAQPGETLVAQVGGRPRVSADFEWPVWEGYGPLSFIAEVDLTELTAFDLDLALPPEGRLLAFYFDVESESFAGPLVGSNEASQAGARLLHVPATTESDSECPAPAGTTEYPTQRLTGWPLITFPHAEHPVLEREFGSSDDPEAVDAHAVDEFFYSDDLADFTGEVLGHRLGGWPAHFQGPIEYWPAQSALDTTDFGDQVTTEAMKWRLLLQIDSDDISEMMWGDVGTLYWLVRTTAEEPAGDLRSVSFAWECS